MSEFMNEYEILGRKMQAKLPGDTGTERLDIIRRAMGQDNRIIVREDNEDDENVLVPVEIGNKKDRWDCETIICRYRVASSYYDLLCMISNLLKSGKPSSNYPCKG